MKLLHFLLLLGITQIGNAQTDKIIDHRHSTLDQIPVNWINSAKSKLHIRYGHTSHGGQLTNGGMWAIRRYTTGNEELYKFSSSGSNGSLKLVEAKEDLSGDYDWESLGRTYLAQNPDCNVMMWAWCGIDDEKANVDEYLIKMERLIKEFGPGGTANREVPVTFVFMTAHSWPWKTNQLVYERNMKIRNFCIKNNYWLYDFYDLESWDPDGKYFGDGNPDGTYSGKNKLRQDCSYSKTSTVRSNWGIEWMQRNPNHEYTKMAADNICTSCKHSEGDSNDDNSRLQCILKGNAAWWLFAKIAGWEGQPTELSDHTPTYDTDNVILVYPNPGIGKYRIVVDLDHKEPTTDFKLFDNSGKTLLMMKVTEKDFNIDLSHFPKGVYYVSITIKQEQWVQKIIHLI